MQTFFKLLIFLILFLCLFFLPELCFEFSESRTLAGVIWPTFGHQTVEGGRTLGRHRQALPVFYPANHVIVFHPLEGLDAVHQDLPHAYAYGGDADTQKSPTVMNHIITQWRWIRRKNNNSPNIQTSLADVNLLKLIDSGAIHLMGSLPLEAETQTQTQR